MLNDLGVDPHIVEQLTAHQMPGMQRVYNHSRYLDAKRDALNLWVDRLELLQNNDEKNRCYDPANLHPKFLTNYGCFSLRDYSRE